MARFKVKRRSELNKRTGNVNSPPRWICLLVSFLGPAVIKSRVKRTDGLPPQPKPIYVAVVKVEQRIVRRRKRVAHFTHLTSNPEMSAGMVHHAIQTKIALDSSVKLSERGGALGFVRLGPVHLAYGPVWTEVTAETSGLVFELPAWTGADIVQVPCEGAVLDAASSCL